MCTACRFDLVSVIAANGNATGAAYLRLLALRERACQRWFRCREGDVRAKCRRDSCRRDSCQLQRHPIRALRSSSGLHPGAITPASASRPPLVTGRLDGQS